MQQMHKIGIRRFPVLGLMGMLWLAVGFAVQAADTPVSQEPAPDLTAATRTITLEQAKALALQADSAVKTARNNLQKARLATKLAVLKSFPQATVTDTLGQNLDQLDETPDKNLNSLTITITENVSTGVHLYGQKVSSDIEAAFWDQVSSEADLVIAQANAIYNVESYYFAALKAQQNLAVLERQVQNSLAAARLADVQLSQGKITKPDQLKAQSDLATARLNLEQGRANYQVALEQLGNEIGINDFQSLKLEDVEFASIPAAVDKARLQSTAIQKRLEMKKAEIAMNKAARALAQMKNQVLPDVSLGYNYYKKEQSQSLSISYSFLSGDITGSAEQSYGDYRSSETTRYSENDIMLKFTWNLGFFGTASNQIAQAELDLENARISRDQTSREIVTSLNQACSDYALAVAKANANQQLIPYYEKQLEIVKVQHQLGVATELDVAKAETNLLQYQVQAAGSNYDRFLAYEKLRLTTGELYPLTNPTAQGGTGK